MRTPRWPKNSLMMSVMMNTIGHSSVPAVKFSEPVCPNRFHSNGAMPSVSSSAKILTPMNSASTALTQKNAASTMNSRVARSASGCRGASAARDAHRAEAARRESNPATTAPPEMMKLIAWSTVQSVGVIFSTGTISR